MFILSMILGISVVCAHTVNIILRRMLRND